MIFLFLFHKSNFFHSFSFFNSVPKQESFFVWFSTNDDQFIFPTVLFHSRFTTAAWMEKRNFFCLFLLCLFTSFSILPTKHDTQLFLCIGENRHQPAKKRFCLEKYIIMVACCPIFPKYAVR